MSDKPSDLRAIVYPTLWTPIMLKGVPRDWAISALIMSAFVMMIAGLTRMPWYQFYGVISMAILWVYGMIRAHFDPEFWSIFIESLKIGSTRDNKDGNEYYS